MNIIKRDGSEVVFNIEKIKNAIRKANAEVLEKERISEEIITAIACEIERYCESMHRALGVEEIQDLVQSKLMKYGGYEVGIKYITYRYQRDLVRKANTTDEAILSLIDCTNEEAKQENANKNPVLASTQRDYMAGLSSRDITERLLLTNDIVSAHKEGIIHFHDSDYYANRIHNCCLVNLEDMLQNGTVISGTKIDKPHSFATACTITTQIIAQVACNQYGFPI